MKLKSQLATLLTIFLSCNVFAADKMAKAPAMKPSAAYTATTDDIRSAVGFMPTMFKQYPQEALPAAWEEMKAVQMNPASAVPGKYKELIGLAVAAQIPCKYCVYFHKKFAMLNGATEREVNEAIAVAGSVRKWSTYVYGSQMDLEAFKKDVDKLVSSAKATAQKSTPSPVATEAANITTADMAMKDVQNMYGFVPGFISDYYKPALPGAWKGLRDFHMSQTTAIPMKYKGLIGLAVGSQMPCTHCVYIDSEMAKANGATADELKEAVLMSATVRNWSTILNGVAVDENTFRREVDQMVTNAKRKMNATDRQAAN
ncbi:hypothetical protein CIK05_11460 [Bdellovibrio sp. qaytius]|nr:hypothetical protein CIK05_11460 [Bdellovibrio sp. qaytius]